MAKKQVEEQPGDPAGPPEGTDLVDWEAKMMQEAKDVAAVERPSVGILSFRGGILTYEGNEVPGNEMPCIIIASAFENRYYIDAWDPDNIESPDCFALGLATEGKVPVMAPHENVLRPLNSTCKGCKMNEWGSDTSRPGAKGKACKEIRRLALIPYKEDLTAEEITNAEVALAKIPVTSVKHWANFVNFVGAKYNRPPWAVAAKISVKPHAKTQIEVGFEFLAPMPTELLSVLNAKREATVPTMMVPYDSKAESEEAPADSDKY
jgi:hypothetical protein